MADKVIIGMSGGVDSSAAAVLLGNSGYEVTGCYLLFTDISAAASESALLAQSTAEKLGIELITADFREHFKKYVTDYFIFEYLRGVTPNPCVRCNPTTKFYSLMKIMRENNAQHIATGHYARVIFDNSTGEYKLCASPSKKDQSYFLYRLPQEYLRHIIFPLGDFESKLQVRDFAAAAGLPAAAKRDSQEICFIPSDDYVGFITSHTDFKAQPGNFLDISGNVIGTHRGIIYYTAGQRKGLGAFGKPYYVKSINAADNTVTLCTACERFSDSVTAENLSWCSSKAPEGSFRGEVKVRSTAAAAPAEISVYNDIMKVLFDSPVLAPAPGQSAVVYKGDTVLGGGIITSELSQR